MCRWIATYHLKALDEGYNFSLDLISIQRLHAKLWAPKVARVPDVRISGLGSLGTMPFGCGPHAEAQSIL